MSAPDYRRYPGYDVMAKRDTPSWDAITREVVDARVATPNQAVFLGPKQWRTLVALCECVIPQTRADTPPAHDANGPVFVPIAALIDAKLAGNHGDGFRDSRLPPLRDAWTIGLIALDAESRRLARVPFDELDARRQHLIVERMQRGQLHSRAWKAMPCEVFFAKRAVHDICAAFYSHPAAWNALGFGGPANPRGYVRLVANRRDPWEGAEAADASADAQREAEGKNRHVR